MKKISLICGLLLSFSSQAWAQNASVDCSDPAKASSKDSTCLQILGQTNTQGVTKNFQSSSMKPFAALGKSCTTPWGQVINDGSSIMAFASSTGSYNYSTGEYAADCTDEIRRCTNGVLSGSYQHKTCTMTPVDATCGPAHGSFYTYPTSGPAFIDKCNPTYTYNGIAPNDDSGPSHPAGTATYLTGNTYFWTCSGEIGGSATSCYAYRRINAQCGTLANNTCSLGDLSSPRATPVYNNYSCNCTYSWTKPGSPSIPYSASDPNNGTYASDGYSYSSSCQTCSTYLHTIYSWTCSGVNGGTSTSCTRIE